MWIFNGRLSVECMQTHLTEPNYRIKGMQTTKNSKAVESFFEIAS